jgi:hypothetical protein
MAVLGRLFPDLLFQPRFCPATERRVQLAEARAQECLLRTHVENALVFVDTLAAEMPFDRAIQNYVRIMRVPEPLASAIASRALVSLGLDLASPRRRARDTRLLRDVTDEHAQNAPGFSGQTVPGLIRQYDALEG